MDYGGKRIGLAVCDELGILSTPLTVLETRGRRTDVPAILAIAEREHAVGIVVGLPIRDDGARTEQTETCARLAAKLAEAAPIPVELHDERFTTWEANQRRAGKRRTGPDDAEAAAVLLESFLRGRQAAESGGLV